MARVLLFTDEPVLARGFFSIVSSVPGFETVSVCHTTAELAETLPKLAPDVLLIDLTPDITFGGADRVATRIACLPHRSLGSLDFYRTRLPGHGAGRARRSPQDSGSRTAA